MKRYSYLTCYYVCVIFNTTQVLGFAVFFALVLKKVDQEEYGDVPIEESVSNAGKMILTPSWYTKITSAMQYR